MHDTSFIASRLAGSGTPLIIDGGMGTELEKSGVPMHSDCWSGVAVLETPESVLKVHTDFIRSGAEVIITNTFSSGRHVLDAAGLADQTRAINTKAVELAREAVVEASISPVAIAGSLCEWASSASEGMWSKPDAVSEALLEQAVILAEAGADLLVVEMAQDRVLSPLAVDAAIAPGLPVWLGLSCSRRKGCSYLTAFDDPNTEFEIIAKDVLHHVQQVGGVSLVNIMHTPVPDVPAAIDILQQYWDGPIGVYPESGFFTMPNWNFVDIITPDDLVTAARSWVSDYDVRLLGGCCGLGPAHVAALRQAFSPAGSAF